MPVWMEFLLNVVGYAGFIGSRLQQVQATRHAGRAASIGFLPSPAVRTSLSALTSARSFSGGARSEKLISTKAAQNKQADRHHPAMGGPVRIVKRRDHGSLREPDLSRHARRATQSRP